MNLCEFIHNCYAMNRLINMKSVMSVIFLIKIIDIRASYFVQLGIYMWTAYFYLETISILEKCIRTFKIPNSIFGFKYIYSIIHDSSSII